MNSKIRGLLFISCLFLFNFCGAAHTAEWELPPTDLSDTSETSFAPEIAIDAAGNSIAVWTFLDVVYNVIQAKRYNVITGLWEDVATDLSGSGQNADDPEVAMDDAGNAMAVWYRDNGANTIIQAKRYDVGLDSWIGTATSLSEPGRDAYEPQVAMNADGDGIAVWRRQNDGARWFIQEKRYDGTTKLWTSIAIDLSNNDGPSFSPDVAIDDLGNAIAVWRMSGEGGDVFIQANRYNVNTDSWLPTATNLSENSDVDLPKIAMNGAGNAIVAWQKTVGGDSFVQANIYDYDDGSWLPTYTTLSDVGENAKGPAVAMDETGNAMVAWYGSDGANDVIRLKIYNANDESWMSTAITLSAPLQNAADPSVTMDAVGNAIVAWDRSNGSNFIIQAKSYDVNTKTWMSTATNLSEPGEDANNARVVLNEGGDVAVAAWKREDDDTGNDVVQATERLKSEDNNITNLTGSKKCYRFPTQLDLAHCLKWDANINAALYRIYLDAGLTDLLAEVPVGSNPCYEVHNRCLGVQVTYYVVLVDQNGDLGVPALVTI